MKKQFYTLAVLLMMGFVAKAQVGIGTSTPNPSSMLDITSTTKGLLMPRMTTGQRTAIPSPTAGLQVYDTTTKSFWYFDGTIWVNAGANLQDLRYLGSNNHVTQDAGVGSNGTSVGTGTNVIGIGTSALAANTTGGINLAIGTSTLTANTSGSGNTGIGTQALMANTTGGVNTALGYLSLQSNTTGNDNVGVGLLAGNNITTGSGNIAIGNRTLIVSPTGSNQLNIANTIYGTGLTGGGVGFIGIGTGSPNAQLQLGNTVANRKFVLFDGFNNDHQFYGLGVNSGSMRYQVDGTGSSHIFYSAASATASNELMRIVGNGNVGIGTSAPITKLNVAADQTSFSNELAQLLVSGTDTSKKLLLGYNTTTDNGYIQSVHSGINWTNLILQPNAGNVGIGTTTPVATLDVGSKFKFYPTGALTKTDPIMIIGSTTNWSRIGTGGGALGFWGDGNTASNDSPNLFVATSGSVGIGTTAPGSKLEINSGATGVSGLKFTNLNNGSTATTGNVVALGVNSSGDVISLGDDNTYKGLYVVNGVNPSVVGFGAAGTTGVVGYTSTSGYGGAPSNAISTAGVFTAVTAGVYRFDFSCAMTNGNAIGNQMEFAFQKNSVTVQRTIVGINVNGTTGAAFFTIQSMAAGNTMRVFFTNQSGTNGNFSNSNFIVTRIQ